MYIHFIYYQFLNPYTGLTISPCHLVVMYGTLNAPFQGAVSRT